MYSNESSRVPLFSSYLPRSTGLCLKQEERTRAGDAPVRPSKCTGFPKAVAYGLERLIMQVPSGRGRTCHRRPRTRSPRAEIGSNQEIHGSDCDLGSRRPEADASAPSFFFQAEDGIRDYKVTGVQTCALPI